MKLLATIILCALAITSYGRQDEMDDFWMNPAAAASDWTPITGMVAHYKMNDNAASKVVLDNAYANNGTSVSNTSVLHTNGMIDGALLMNADNSIVASNAAQLNITNSMTMMAWVRRTGAMANNFLFTKGVGNYGYGEYNINIGNNIIGASYSFAADAASALVTASLPTNQWCHLVVMIDKPNNRCIVYTNGTWAGSANYTKGTFGLVNTGLLYIGNSDARYNFIGYLDDGRIYNRLLTSNEVSQIYNGGAGTELE